ncbi:MAG TPA: CoA-binding protein [Candidatus Acidoferrales bacterium]|nr:CoA-binding protein [Candidatus Acidoferrales bacterium]
MIEDELFNPSSVAIVGATNDPQKRGNSTIRFLERAGFRGAIYPVNPKYNEVRGYKCYPTLDAIPGPVDHAVCCLPAQRVPALAEECVRKRIKLLHVYSAGFSETRIPERIELERQLVSILRAGGVRLLGPNCMGIYRPAAGLAFNTHSPTQPGTVSLISQSGGNASDLGRMASVRGLRFNTVVSYGNAADIDETELLEFFARDAGTEVIGAFIEGVREMPRFLDTLSDVSRTKPVVIVKGGVTQAGARAAAAHTGALASAAAWEAVWANTRAVPAANMEELADVLLAFQSLKAPAGPNVGVVGIGGGDAIQAADDLETAGLKVPELRPETQAAIREFTPLAGTSVNNPLDLNVMRQAEKLGRILDLVAREAAIHTVAVVLRVDQTLGNPQGGRTFAEMVEAVERFCAGSAKPVVIVARALGSLESFATALKLQEKFDRIGAPVYPSITRAAQALGKYLRYAIRNS